MKENLQKNKTVEGEHTEIASELHMKKTDGVPQGGYTSISLTGMLVREQTSTTQKNRMTLNSNPKK